MRERVHRIERLLADLGRQLVQGLLARGGADQGERGDLAELGVGGAEQRLASPQGTRTSVEDRLEGDGGGALAEHGRHQVLLVPRRRRRAAGLFGLAHVLLGDPHHVVERVVDGVADPDSHADVDGDQPARDRDRRGHRLDQPLHVGGHGVAVDAAQQQRELVAGEARDRRRRGRCLLQPAGDLAQHLVGVEVTELLVELLELVEVQEQQRQHLALGALTDGLLGELDEHRVVPQPGHRVGDAAQPETGLAEVDRARHAGHRRHRLEQTLVSLGVGPVSCHPAQHDVAHLVDGRAERARAARCGGRCPRSRCGSPTGRT